MRVTSISSIGRALILLFALAELGVAVYWQRPTMIAFFALAWLAVMTDVDVRPVA